MLINISNHPSTRWEGAQIKAARQLAGEVVDIEFPSVSPHMLDTEVLNKAHELAMMLKDKIEPSLDVVHVMGEMTFCFALVNKLLHMGIRCVASTTERHVSYNEQGEKISHFHFVAFREYILSKV